MIRQLVAAVSLMGSGGQAMAIECDRSNVGSSSSFERASGNVAPYPRRPYLTQSETAAVQYHETEKPEPTEESSIEHGKNP